METVDVFWFIDHYENHCRENALKVNEGLPLTSVRHGAAKQPRRCAAACSTVDGGGSSGGGRKWVRDHNHHSGRRCGQEHG